MEQPDLVSALRPVVDALENLGVPYRIGGSVASSLLGLPRTTLDADIVCDIEVDHVSQFVARLADDYYVDAEMILEAIRRRASFNVVHLASMLKVDLFVLKRRAYDREAFKRVTRKALEDLANARLFDVVTAEDIVLAKLEWFKDGGEVSDRQWGDVLGVLKVQGDVIDVAYMRKWAEDLGIDDLLSRALRDAGVAQDEPTGGSS